MSGSLAGISWNRLARLRRQKRWQNLAFWSLIGIGMVLSASTVVMLGPMSTQAPGRALRFILLLDLLYLIVLIGLVIARLVSIVAARRASAAGSRLHMRLVGIFAGLALVPTVLVALFAGFLVNIGLEGWFSDRVQQVVTTSQAAAEAYQDEHRRDLTDDAQLLAGVLMRAGRANPLIEDGQMRELLVQAQAQI